MSDGPQEAPAGTQRVAVVTGGARGIGARTAQRLASDGLAVAVLDLKEGDCGATVDAITAAAGCCDVEFDLASGVRARRGAGALDALARAVPDAEAVAVVNNNAAALVLAATALGLILASIWCAALGQSAVAAVFGIFGTFWLSYAVLVLGLDHNWFAITAIAVLATVKLFLVSWLVIIVMLTLATLRLPLAFSVLFALVALALLMLLLAFAEASAAGPSTGLLKTGGYVVLVFAALGVYLFFSASSVGTGGKAFPLGAPVLHG